MATETKEKQDKNNSNISVQPKEIDINGKTLKELQEMAKYLVRGKERGLINESTGSSITLRNSGQINISSSMYSQYKLNPNGINTEYAIESNLVTNRRNIKTDEIIINDHKLNSDLYEFTDMKEVKTSTCSESFIVGNFTMYGSVLVKAWEPDLKRYMLIRRPCRMPMFSPKLNIPEIHTALGINDPLHVTESILAYSPDKGYQVNEAQTDGKTYIRDADGDGYVDAGEDRAGINRNNMNVIGANVGGGGGAAAAGGGGGGFAGSAGVVNTATVESIFQALRKVGYSDSAACGIMGNMMQECSMDPTSGSSGKAYAIGLCQWGYGCDGGRGDNMVAWAQSSGKDPWNAGTQIDWMMKEISESYYTCSPSAMNSMSAADACTRFCTDFEAPGEPMLENRIKYANEYYSQFKGK